MSEFMFGCHRFFSFPKEESWDLGEDAVMHRTGESSTPAVSDTDLCNPATVFVSLVDSDVATDMFCPQQKLLLRRRLWG